MASIRRRLKAGCARIETITSIKGGAGRSQRNVDRRDESSSGDPTRDRSLGHPALLLVDAVSSLAAIELRHDEWGLDVTLSASQKGLMLPPGLSFTAISEKALAASRSARLPRSYFSWDQMLPANANGFFPYTPATNLLFGLREAIAMLEEEGLENVFARHRRLAAAARAAVRAWGLAIACEREDEHSPVVTTILMPDADAEAGPDVGADRFRSIVLERFNMSLGSGLGRFKGRAFRIGHLGDFNDLMLLGTLCGVEMGLAHGWSAVAAGRRRSGHANADWGTARGGDPCALIISP